MNHPSIIYTNYLTCFAAGWIKFSFEKSIYTNNKIKWESYALIKAKKSC
jgi:hypothetical protein